MTQFTPFTIILCVSISISLFHLRTVLQRTIIIIIRISLSMTYACTQFSSIFKSFLIDTFTDQRIFFTAYPRIIIYHRLSGQQFGIAATILGINICTHDIESQELLVLQVFLKIKI